MTPTPFKDQVDRLLCNRQAVFYMAAIPHVPYISASSHNRTVYNPPYFQPVNSFFTGFAFR